MTRHAVCCTVIRHSGKYCIKQIHDFFSETERKQTGRANSRFRGLNRVNLLFPKRKPFIPIGRGRSTEAPFTTTNEDIVLTGFGSRSTQKPFTTPTTRKPLETGFSKPETGVLKPENGLSPSVSPEGSTENSLLSFFRGRGTRKPFRPRVRTTR